MVVEAVGALMGALVYNDGLMARSEGRLYIYIYIRGLGLEFSDNLLDKK